MLYTYSTYLNKYKIYKKNSLNTFNCSYHYVAETRCTHFLYTNYAINVDLGTF